MEQIRSLWGSRCENNRQWYVYLYIDPRDSSVFYVGKGKENRVFDHLSDKNEKEKAKKIEEIRAEGHEPDIDILADNLDEDTALKIESAAIDLLGVENLSNVQRGHNHQRCPIYKSWRLREEVIIKHNVIVIIINKFFPKYFDNCSYDSSKEEDTKKLFSICRMMWKLKHDKIKNIQLILVSYQGTILDVFEIDHTRSNGVIKVGDAFNEGLFNIGEDGKYYFEDDRYRPMSWMDIKGAGENRSILFGRIADDETRNLYRNKYLKTESKGNPIKYFMNG